MTTPNLLFTASLKLKSARVALVGVMALGAAGCFATTPSEPDITLKEMATTANAASGWEYLEQGAYEAAVPAFQLALSKTPDDEKLRFGLAEALRHTGRIAVAEAQYAKLLNSAEFRVAALTGIGHVKLASYDTNGAYEMFSTATAEDETAWKAWLGLAQLKDLANDWAAADDAYAKALEHAGDRALVLNNQGVSMLARGDFKKAAVYFDMAAAIDPGSQRTQTNLDLTRAALEGDMDLSRYEYLDAKSRAQKFNNWGYAAMLRGDLDRAELYFEQAIDVHPSFYAIAHKNLRTLQAVRNVSR